MPESGGAFSIINSQLVLVPVYDTGTSPHSYLGTYGASQLGVPSFNDSAQGSSYSFRKEEVSPSRVPTVRRVIITYRDLGTVAITLTLSGTNDSGAVTTITSPSITLGNAAPTADILTKFIDLELTAFRPQLTINRAANAGPLSIVSVTLVGEVEDTTL